MEKMSTNDVVTSLSDNTNAKVDELLNAFSNNIDGNTQNVEAAPQESEQEAEESFEENPDRIEQDSSDENTEVKKEVKPKRKRDHLGKIQRDNHNLLRYSNELAYENQLLQENLRIEKLAALDLAITALEKEEETFEYYEDLADEQGDRESKRKIKRTLREIDDKKSEMQRLVKALNANGGNYQQQDSYPAHYPQDNNRFQEYEVRRPVEEDLSQDYVEWISQNKWADMNSKSYNKALEMESRKEGDLLAKRYALAGKSHLVGKKEFFNDLTRTLNNNYFSNADSRPANVVGVSSNISRNKLNIPAADKEFLLSCIQDNRHLNEAQKLDLIAKSYKYRLPERK